DVRILNVPYKGTAPALTDVLGDQVDMMFIILVTGTAQVRAGKLRAYGVTSAQRQPSFPDLPAIGEIVQGFESTAWFGVFGPRAHAPGSDLVIAPQGSSRSASSVHGCSRSFHQGEILPEVLQALRATEE